MWILIGTILGILISVGIFVAVCKYANNNNTIQMIASFVMAIFIVGTTVFPVVITKKAPDSTYNYKADIENYNTAYFTTYSQEGNCVVIPDHYTYNGWQMKLEYHEKPLLIKIPEGQEFEYIKFRTEPVERQHVVNDCSEP